MIRLAAVVGLALFSSAFAVATPEVRTIVLGGRPQTVYVYKPAAQPSSVVILSSGDLGWSGLVTEVADYLVSNGVGVLGLNARSYLASFTSGSSRLNPADVPGHFQALAAEAERAFNVRTRPVLAGVSEGAGLSVIAASDPARKSAWSGVVAMGLPASTELGWRTWVDWTIWVTKKAPNEPLAQSSDYMGKLTVPFVSIQSTRDEFVPLATAKSLFAAAPEPKRLFLIDASNHRFSDKRAELHERLSEALKWISELAAGRSL